MSNIRTATLVWRGDLRFEGGVPGGPTIPVDADGTTAPGPMAQLLVAAAACSAADLVEILRKSRVALSRCDVEVTGTRHEDHPRRFIKLHLAFRLAGEGMTEDKAARAIELSVTKYCSVINSLNPDIPVTTEFRLD